MKQGKEFGVGLFAIIGLLLFGVFVFSIGKFTGPTRKIQVEFGNVDGLAAGAPVHYAGYSIGSVKAVTIVPGAQVRLVATLIVPKDLPITRASAVSIGSSGFMGDKVIEILPAPGGEPLPDGEVLKGSDPIQLSQIFGKVGSMFDESTSGNIRQIATNILRATEDMNVFTTTLRKISSENGGDISRLLANASQSSDHLPGLMKSAEAAAVKIDKAAASITALSENLKGLTAETRPEIEQIVGNLNATSANLKALSDDVRRHPWKLIRKSSGEPEEKVKKAGTRSQ